MDFMVEVNEEDDWDVAETIGEVTKFHFFPGMHADTTEDEGGVASLNCTLEDVKLGDAPLIEEQVQQEQHQQQEQQEHARSYPSYLDEESSEAAFRKFEYGDEDSLEEWWGMDEDLDPGHNFAKKKGKRGVPGFSHE
jgi:hypothetical protein